VTRGAPSGLVTSGGGPAPRERAGVASWLTRALARARAGLARAVARLAPSRGGAGAGGGPVVLDTSVIIDGRVVGVCETGFVEGRLLVPGAVLRELQQIEAAPDSLRRNRARRGFAVLERLRQMPRVAVEVDGRDFPSARQVDDKVVALARAVGGRVLTNDVGLARRAVDAGVTALNVNELADALRAVALPGERLTVRVLKEGREAGQGVGYLDDGTMVVIDQGRGLVGRTAEVTVTTMLQTRAGRMIFARPAAGEDGAR
jgi:uncharacterized protein YacL